MAEVTLIAYHSYSYDLNCGKKSKVQAENIFVPKSGELSFVKRGEERVHFHVDLLVIRVEAIAKLIENVVCAVASVHVTCNLIFSSHVFIHFRCQN